jgi:allantoate deiminase
MADRASTVMRRIEALGKISDEPGRLTRTFCSPAMRRALRVVGSWMKEAGMAVREDAIGNLIGHYAASAEKRTTRSGKVDSAPVFLLGSHLDTVRDAGRFDGALGVIGAIACVQRLRATGTRFPFAIEVLGFADEEGVRYQSAYLGSRALVDGLAGENLKRADADSVIMADAIRDFGGRPASISAARRNPRRLLGYAEIHIEQGPVLEEKKLPLAVVTGIAGQTRARVTFTGRAGHAGTTPMKLRRDALCAASEFILAAEARAGKRDGLVATVGEITASPGAGNVIPGVVRLSLDVRHAQDAVRLSAVAGLRAAAAKIAESRKARLEWQPVHETPAVACDRRLSAIMRLAVERHQPELVELASGAGHDAAALAAITPVAMLFVRCKGGISHHPDESVTTRDVRAAIGAMDDFIQLVARQRESSVGRPVPLDDAPGVR